MCQNSRCRKILNAIRQELLNTILRSLKSPVVNLTQSVFANDDVLLKNYTPAAEILVEDSCE